MAKEVFNRYELKYIVNKALYKELLQALQGHVFMDKHGDQDGYYMVMNLYYDTADHLFFNETVNRQQFRQKLRLRGYNHINRDSNVFLEIKKKYRGVVYKRRTLLKLPEAYAFLADTLSKKDYSLYDASNTQILGEVDFLKQFYQLEPKVIVSYDRQAFQGIHEEDLRVTFDRNLLKRETDLRIESRSDGELFMDPSLYVLEVKVNDRIPLWLSHILNDFQCWRQGYSKYTSSYNSDLHLRDHKIG